MEQDGEKHASCRFIPIARMLRSALCPVNAYSPMVSLVPALPSEPAFANPHKGKLRPFSCKEIDYTFRAVLSACDLDAKRIVFIPLDGAGQASLQPQAVLTVIYVI